MLVPPQSLQVLLCRSCSHLLRALIAGSARCLFRSVPALSTSSPTSSSGRFPSAFLPATALSHSRHVPLAFPCVHLVLPRSPPPSFLALAPRPAERDTPPVTPAGAPARSTRSRGRARRVAAPVKRVTAGCAHCGHLRPRPASTVHAWWKGGQAHSAQRRAEAVPSGAPHRRQGEAMPPPPPPLAAEGAEDEASEDISVEAKRAKPLDRR